MRNSAKVMQTLPNNDEDDLTAIQSNRQKASFAFAIPVSSILIIAMICLLLTFSSANAAPTGTDITSSEESALRMLRSYLKSIDQLPSPYELAHLDIAGSSDGGTSGYVIIEDLKSNKRGLGMGPRPLRFG
ncbi:hypothetical protein DdX_04079 [Ditylenchus destructor]|uniref:Uncharacterized protein n=1 Tax=Ditylenchus destructor TaxID=166010 RepID=A0AAD4NGF5_9BILA|nr:hypothetical protein DdX_04079 [Ditylenchus destructor]